MGKLEGTVGIVVLVGKEEEYLIGPDNKNLSLALEAWWHGCGCVARRLSRV